MPASGRAWAAMMPVLKGSYALIIRRESSTPLTIGRLGSFAFPAGLYLYAGSALNGLESRVRRHLRRDNDKKRHWHIDYLTAIAPVGQVWWAADEMRRECAWAGIVRERGGRIVAPGFGRIRLPPLPGPFALSGEGWDRWGG